MNILTVLALSLALSPMRFSQPLPAPVAHAAKPQAHKGGKWYFADSGHAVYCYGPVMMVTQTNGALQRVATFCRVDNSDETMVPLRD